MIRRVFMIAATFLLANTTNLAGQTSSHFGTCAYWQEHKTGATKASAVVNKSYRVGFAHGFVFGILGDLPREAKTDPGWAVLENRYGEGLIEALQRPAFLVDAFDQKCGDYRNRRVSLSDIGLLVLLEVGGLPAQRIEQALQIMRAGGDDYKARALDILSAMRSQ